MFLFVLALLAVQSKTHKVSIGFCCLAVRVVKDAPKTRQTLNLLLVAARNHLSGQDLRSLVQFLEREDLGFEVTLQVADPAQQPELLELHRLVVTPALIKLSPNPKQVFAGSNILQQLKGWVPRWKQDGVVSGLGLSLRPTELDGLSLIHI